MWSFTPQHNDLVIMASKSVKAGEELTISYGNLKSAEEIVEAYGFISEGASIRSVPLPGTMLSQDVQLVFKSQQTLEGTCVGSYVS